MVKYHVTFALVILLHTCDLILFSHIGKYDLVDFGYPNKKGFLAPYRGQRYHIPEFQGGRMSRPIYKNINRAIIYAPGSSHAYIQQIIKISQHMSRIKAYKL
jgi:hypothetical protein